MTNPELVSGGRKRSANSAPFTTGIEKRLCAYALAAGAGGVGLLALALPAEAEIVYTPVHRTLQPNHHLSIDLNNDGIADITLNNEIGLNTSSRSDELFASGGVQQNAVITSHTNFALALPAGAPIGSSGAFSIVGFMAFGFRAYGGTTIIGLPWANVTRRYLGVRFQINGETHYGWARLSVKVANARVVAGLTGYAYETIANQPLKAGQTTGTADDAAAASDAGTLGVLALGSAH